MTEDDKQRLTISIGIIASWLAYLSVRTNFSTWIGKDYEHLLLFGISFTALLSLVYFTLIAGTLKYRNKSNVGHISFTQLEVQTLYDLSIDTFGTIPEYILAAYMIHKISSELKANQNLGTLELFLFLFFGILIINIAIKLFLVVLTLVYTENRKPLVDYLKSKKSLIKTTRIVFYVAMIMWNFHLYIVSKTTLARYISYAATTGFMTILFMEIKWRSKLLAAWSRTKK